MLAKGFGSLVVIAATLAYLLQSLARSPIRGAGGDASVSRPPSGLLAASDRPFVAFSLLLGGYRLPAELELVGSSVPDVAEALTSSLATYGVGSTLSLGPEAPG